MVRPALSAWLVDPPGDSGVVFNEIAGAGAVASWGTGEPHGRRGRLPEGFELVQRGHHPEASFTFPGESPPAGGFQAPTAAEVGFQPAAGDQWTQFYTPGRGSVADAVTVKKKL